MKSRSLDSLKFYHYLAMLDGRVLGRRGKYLKPDKFGRVTLYKDYKPYCRSVGSIILKLFKGPCPRGYRLHRLDGNPQNNGLGNLCWKKRTWEGGPVNQKKRRY